MRSIYSCLPGAVVWTVLAVLNLVFLMSTRGGTLEPEASLRSFHARAEKEEPLRVAFLGGSLTWGANASDPNRTSYRGRMMTWLQEHYPNTAFTFLDAAIGGTGSKLGMFRVERDVLAYQPDLVFLEFTINDGPTGKDMESLAAYESIVRRLLRSGAMVMPVLTMVKAHAQDLEAPLPPRHQAHLRLAKAYQLPVANVIPHVRKQVAAGISPDELWPFEATHPDDAGYHLYFEAVRDKFLEARQSDQAATLPEDTVFDDLYPKVTRRKLLDQALPEGWKSAKTYRTSLWYDGLSSRWMDEVACATAEEKPEALELEFEGSFVGLLGERNGYTPDIRVWIDDQPVGPRGAKGKDNLWSLNTAKISPAKKGMGNLFLWLPLASGLGDGKHRLRIEPVWEGTSEGAELRLESICSAGR